MLSLFSGFSGTPLLLAVKALAAAGFVAGANLVILYAS